MFLYQNFIKPNDCKSTITTATGFASFRDICSGHLIFEENFENKLDKLIWRPDVTFGAVSEKKKTEKKTIFNTTFLENRMDSFNGMLMTLKIHL